jgi:GcrA cell cycle regulator
MSAWTQDELATLTRLWTAGIIAREIMADLPGRSRSSILGQVNRMGMTGRARKTPPPRPFVSRVDNDHRIAVILDVQRHGGTSRDAALRLGLRPDTARKAALRLGVPFGTETRCKAPRKPHSGPKPKPGTRDRKSVKGVHQAPLRRTEAPPPAGAIGLMQLRDETMFGSGTCKWPVNDGNPFLFCGHKTTLGNVYCGYHRSIAYAGHPGGASLEAAE